MTTANQDTSTGLELTVPIDTDNITNGSLPVHDEASASVDYEEGADVCDEAEAADQADDAETAQAQGQPRRRLARKRVLAYGVLPALAMILTVGAAYLKWQDRSAALSQVAGHQSTQAATDSVIAMLSYRPDTVDKDLLAAGNRLNGKFRDEYTQLINDVVIPGAKEKKISAVAKVPAAASVSANANHAVVLVFVDQTITIGDDAPTDNASTVRVTLDKVRDRWLISEFTPI